jgi:hypothetical protein
VEDGVVEGGATFAFVVGSEFRKVAVTFIEALESVKDRGGGCGEVVGEAQVVAEADGEDLVAGVKDGVEEFLDVFAVALEEVALAVAGVDEQAECERQVGLLCRRRRSSVERRLRLPESRRGRGPWRGCHRRDGRCR